MKYLFLFLITTFMFSQNTKVIYQFETNFNDKQLNDEYIGQYMKNIQEVAHYIEYQLIFNDTLGNFSLVPKNVVDENYATAVDFSSGSSKSYYIKNNFYRYTGYSLTFKEKEFLVENKIDSNWTITKDTLNVNGYKCFKAFTVVEIKHNNKTYKHEKTAWFCPEIPAYYGPDGNGGLPGLILIFEESGKIFKMKTITFNDTTKIEIPVLKNLLSEDEYLKKIDESAKNGFKD